jgi:hypothetical protein
VRISLRVKGREVANKDLGGSLLIRPGGMRVVERSSSDLVLELASGKAEAPDLLVGEVPLVWWDAGRRLVEVSFVKVPPPRPFSQGDIAEMWERPREMLLPSPYSPPGQGRETSRARRMDKKKWLRPEAVPRARWACQRLLDRWPDREDVTTLWSPPDMRGAPEDLAETDRRAGSRPGKPGVGGVRIPDRVARRHRSSSPWTSAGLAAACSSLAKAMEGQLASPDEADFIQPIRRVAMRAGASRRIDPSRSSWPPVAQRAYGAVLDARISLALGSGASDRVPLSDVWRLYENWLVVAVVEALRPLLGDGEGRQDEIGWSWEWMRGSTRIRVRAQATIGADPQADLGGHPDGLFSVLSDLRPDVLVTACHPDGGQAVLCVDAKRRSSMEASQIAEAGAKYIWGIRSGADTEKPLASVIVASSTALKQMHDEESSRLLTRFLLPSQGRDEFVSLVREKVESLLAAVDPL